MTKSEGVLRKNLEGEMKRAADLLATGKREQMMDEFVLSTKRALELVQQFPFNGRRMGEAQGYREAKRLVEGLFTKVDTVYRGAVPYPLQELMGFSDLDFAIAMTQGLDVWGLVDRQTGLDSRLKTWLVLGIYAYMYEFSAKVLMSLARVLTDKPCESSGSALKTLKERFGARALDQYFDPFLRNAIDHSEFVLKDTGVGRIEAWRIGKRGKIRKEYDASAVGDMTVGLLFFSMAYLSKWYEKVTELDEAGHLRFGR